jgi:hypothetical protein
MEKTLGGDRLGSGKKMKVAMRNYERSTHDLGYIWRSTMAPGTLVPFMKKVALPGDTFDIDLEADVKTHPTLGPLFGSFKLQLDIFLAPIRLYHAALHNNKLGIGLSMEKIKLPQIEVTTNELNINSDEPVEIQQISQSSLLAYLGIRGNGRYDGIGSQDKKYNAVPYLAYWDIYKNYYANKQEEIGAYITKGTTATIISTRYNGTLDSPPKVMASGDGMEIVLSEYINANMLEVNITTDNYFYKINDVFQNVIFYPNPTRIQASYPKPAFIGKTIAPQNTRLAPGAIKQITKIETFELNDIDEMREKILRAPLTAPFVINKDEVLKPYGAIINYDSKTYENNMKWNLNGLALKTYNSDIFNNWLKTEFIEGENGINDITAVDTSSGSFNIDTLILAEKVYNMLNRIAISGGTYEDWVQAVYSHEGYKRIETPIYMGGMSKEVIFQEVINQSGTENEPLASLAGRGTVGNRKKGGKITIKVNEPAYIIGIVSLTPRIDYSQGNEWDVKLKSINDLHKPALDQIGFQDLPTWEMAAWEDHGTSKISGTEVTYSAGKQPAWLNYMTDFNRVYGNFADPNNEMFMTLNRRYEMDENYRIADLTTYIDPSKFNYIFAQTELDAQNFWVQIACDVTARRKMSAKVIPNL